MNKRVSNFEPRVTATDANYTSVLSRAFNYYNQELDKKDARAFIKSYLKNNQIVINYFDKIPDNKIILSYGWIARILENGNSITEKHLNKFNEYLNELKTFVPAKENEVVEAEKPNRPSIQDYMHEKIADVLGELEGALDDFIKDNKELDLYSYLTSNSVPKPYCTYIDAWARKSVQEYIAVYETDDAEIKEAYANLGRRKLAQIIKLFGSWVADIERYSQFKKANRKPRVKKAKPAGVQVAKLKFKKDLPELGLKSVIASDIVKRPHGTLLFKTRDEDDFFTKMSLLLNDFKSSSVLSHTEIDSVNTDYRKYYSGLINSVIHS